MKLAKYYSFILNSRIISGLDLSRQFVIEFRTISSNFLSIYFRLITSAIAWLVQNYIRLLIAYSEFAYLTVSAGLACINLL